VLDRHRERPAGRGLRSRPPPVRTPRTTSATSHGGCGTGETAPARRRRRPRWPTGSQSSRSRGRSCCRRASRARTWCASRTQPRRYDRARPADCLAGAVQ
jgi:hypothetical protein